MPYTIQPRLKTVYKWFLKTSNIVVFDIYKSYRVWEDPSHGHGGGDWEDRTMKVATVSSEGKAQELLHVLNKDYIVAVYRGRLLKPSKPAKVN